MIEVIGKGDEVVIFGGLLGKIIKVNEIILLLEVVLGVELQVQCLFIVQVLFKGIVK